MSVDYVQAKAREKADEHVRMCIGAGLRPSWESLFMAGYQAAADYENHVRLSRYDRAVFLLQLAGAALHQPENDSVFAQVDNFLAEEPKP